MNTLEKIADALATYLHYVAGAAVVGMMLITCADVVLRYLRMPIPGAYELVSFLGGISVAFAMAHTTLGKGHVAVSIVVRRFSKFWQNTIDATTSFLGFLLFGLATWKILSMARGFQINGETSLTLQIPLYPLAYGIGIAIAVVSFVLFTAFLKHFGKAAR